MQGMVWREQGEFCIIYFWSEKLCRLVHISDLQLSNASLAVITNPEPLREAEGAQVVWEPLQEEEPGGVRLKVLWPGALWLLVGRGALSIGTEQTFPIHS